MNNIRKIITERLKNAKYDYECHKHISLKDSPIMVSLESEIQTYQDCLNLLPAPRTKQEILKDFEALGYKVNKSFSHIILLHENGDEIKIWFNDKTYSSSIGINMQEHKLLNELFTIYGWL